MPWKSVGLHDLCKRYGIDYDEHMQKHTLVRKIIGIRKRNGISQSELAKRLGIYQPRIARIESRFDVRNISFETLFKMLAVLGYACHIIPQKVANQKIAA